MFIFFYIRIVIVTNKGECMEVIETQTTDEPKKSVDKFEIQKLITPRTYGIVEMTIDEYLADTTALSSSQLRAFMDSPNVFRQTVIDREPKAERDCFRYGKAIHTFLLEPKLFHEQFVVMNLPFKDFKTKAARAARDKFIADAKENKRQIVTIDEIEEIKLIARNIQRHKRALDLIVHGVPEVTIFFRDPLTGLNLKSRLDYSSFGGKMVTEVKSTKNCRRTLFGSEVFKRRYDVQVGMQGMACESVYGFTPQQHTILATEKESCEVAGYYFLSDDLFPAKQATRTALNYLAECIELNTWPMRQTEMERIYIPSWFINQETQAEETEANEYFEQ